MYRYINAIIGDEYDIIIYPNGGDLKDIVCHIGNLSIADNDKLFRAFNHLIDRGILFR